MINALIIATVSASAVYFTVAFVATMRDRLMLRFQNDNARFQILDPTEPVAIAKNTTAPANDTRDFKSPLPTKIRELRDYIRENQLQARVKERIGKTVSKCSKDELIAAIA